MRLIGSPLPAPNPRRVDIFVAEKAIDLPRADISLANREHKTAAFLEKNSLGQVPVLELDNGTVISESVSICRYLEGLYPNPPLFGGDDLERVIVDMWVRRIDLVVLQPVRYFWGHAHPRTAAVVAQFQDFGNSNRLEYAKTLRWLDGELREHPFIAGEFFSIADICALTVIDFATLIGLEIESDLPSLLAWHARVSRRPSVLAVGMAAPWPAN